MDEKDHARKRPVNNHPNSVQASPDDEEEIKIEDKPQTPRAKEAEIYLNQSNKGKKIGFTLVAVCLLLVAAGVYWFALKPKPSKTPVANPAANSVSKQSATAETKLETEHHESPNFNLGFDFPKGWKVSDISGSGKLTATSTVVKLKDHSGIYNGQIVMTIRDKSQKLTEFEKGNATSIIGSEKITYKKPSETQRGSTYISFLNYASSEEPQIDGIYITGDAGYEKQQSIPSTDITKIDPLINVTFLKCSDNSCSGTPTASGVSAEEWEINKDFSKPIKTILQSLNIQ
jgi:hypothetical protein